LLIGDDDFLLPSYFETVDALLARHGQPECLTYNALSYVSPDGVSGRPLSYYRERHFSFGSEFVSGTAVAAELRREIVRDFYRFDQRLPMNMQMTVIARTALERLRNGLFQSPFPDHYALSALLLTADTWFYSNAAPIIVGVSAKSFGRFFHSGEADSGLAYLGVVPAFGGMLPGNEVLNATCAWLSQLHRDYQPYLKDVDVRRGDYVLRQLYAWVRQYRTGALTRSTLLARLRLVSARDWLAAFGAPFSKASLRDMSRVVTTARTGEHPYLRSFTPVDGITNIADFAQWVVADGR
jgi:hypothetical protein